MFCFLYLHYQFSQGLSEVSKRTVLYINNAALINDNDNKNRIFASWVNLNIFVIANRNWQLWCEVNNL